jgi:hypothetical protein
MDRGPKQGTGTTNIATEINNEQRYCTRVYLEEITEVLKPGLGTIDNTLTSEQRYIKGAQA